MDRNARATRRTGGAHEGRSHPYAREQNNNNRQQRQDEQEEDDDDPNMPANAIRVSASFDARRLADSICQGIRDGEPPALMTIGNGAVNQAVKV